MHHRIFSALALLILLSGCREQVCRDPSYEIVGDRCVCPSGTLETFERCEPVDGGPDTGTPDTGIADTSAPDTADASVTPDADVEDTQRDALVDTNPPPDPPAVTTLRWPPNGYNTGSVHVPEDAPVADHPLRPKLMWEQVAGATEYQVQLDDSCSLEGFGDCPFTSPEFDTRGEGVAAPTGRAVFLRPSVSLPVSMTAPVGTRYVWRVRGCNAGGCGSWSDARYVNVGRQDSDFNGDGFADLLVGAPSADNPEVNEGNVFIFNGRSTGVPRTPTTTLDCPLDRPSAAFGQAVAALGDVDGDGFSDAAIGAPNFSSPEDREGAVFMFFGGRTGLAASPDVTLDSPRDQANMGFGAVVARAGDTNSDGYVDLVVAAKPSRSMATPAGHLFLGSGDGIRLTPEAEFACRVSTPPPFAMGCGGAAAAIDMNGDGSSDLVLGDPEWRDGDGTVYIANEPSSAVYSSHILPPTNGSFGFAVAAGGDVNGDGFGDLFVGAPYASNPEDVEGNAYLFAGGVSFELPTRTLDNPTDFDQFFGSVVANGGDLNGDGFSDLLVGRLPRIYLGTGDGLPRAPDLDYEGGADQVSIPGDLNGDGYLDYVITFQEARDSTSVFLGGATLPRTPHRVLEGDGGFGVAVAR